jgi:cytidylate kinase
MALVAAHPVAGKETTGATAADRDLFKDRRVIITPSSRSTPEALDKIETLWRATGARVERMDADLHDLLLARASHLPQLVSTTLAAALVEERVKDRFAATYGAGGLRDTTRLAASSPEMWRDICLTNRDAILDALKLFSGAYAELERLIENSDSDGVEALFKRAARIRTVLENKKGPVVAIDGPVGAGKSSVARELARALNFSHINTGAMYRAVALAARDAGISFDSPGRDEALSKLLRAIEIRFEGERIFLDGRDVTGMLAETEIGDLASRFSTLPAVRDRMRELQRLAGAQGNVVMEGRDIGTAVFPDADFKFYLDADVKLRAERRFAELSAKGTDIPREEVLAQIIERDRRDSTRELAPLRCADDAIVVDSTELAIAQVVEQIKNKIKGNVRGRHRA